MTSQNQNQYQNQGQGQSQIEIYLEKKRSLITRLSPKVVHAQVYETKAAGTGTAGMMIIDTRPESFRKAEGAIPGAIVIERNVLEWRLDPTCLNSIEEARQPGFIPVIMCNEGYASSLAVQVLHEIGVKGAVDLDGGFRRWKAEGLPVVEG